MDEFDLVRVQSAIDLHDVFNFFATCWTIWIQAARLRCAVYAVIAVSAWQYNGVLYVLQANDTKWIVDRFDAIL
jgi:hypothetical protein